MQLSSCVRVKVKIVSQYAGPKVCLLWRRLCILAGSYWTLTYLATAPQANTYTVIASDRQGNCNSYLSTSDCGANYVDIYNLVSL